jgi:hypothetical protein
MVADSLLGNTAVTYNGIPGDRKPLGIKPTDDDRKFVHTMSVMGIGVRQICVALGERFKLGKPMSRQTMYWHFRKNLVSRKRGRKPSKATVARRWENSLTEGMQSMIDEINARRKAKNKSKRGG